MSEIGVSDRRMSYFVALVEQQSFSAAATYCGVTQSALSQQIVKLEADLGGVLLDRSVRPFVLTPLGRKVYGHALDILENYQEITNAARRTGSGAVGRIRLAMVPTLLYLGVVPRAIRDFRIEYPNVRVDLSRLDNADAIARLLDRQLDAVFSFSSVRSPHVHGIRLDEQELVVALPDTHALARRVSIELTELRHDEFISFPREAYADSQDGLLQVARMQGFSPTVRNVHATFLEHTGFVAAGFGVALVPSALSRYPVDGVSFVPLGSSRQRLATWLYWRADSNDPSVTRFVETVTEHLGVPMTGGTDDPE